MPVVDHQDLAAASARFDDEPNSVACRLDGLAAQGVAELKVVHDDVHEKTVSQVDREEGRLAAWTGCGAM